jgi:hypothetical protein
LSFGICVLWDKFVFSITTDLCFKTQICFLKSKFLFYGNLCFEICICVLKSYLF